MWKRTKTAVDFWMTDRARDCGKFLEELGIGKKKVLKCCAHVLLEIDHAIDKVFRDTEIKMGVQKLMDVSVGQKAFLSPSISIHTPAQIALYFVLCSEVYTEIDELIIFPMMKLLEFDRKRPRILQDGLKLGTFSSED